VKTPLPVGRPRHRDEQEFARGEGVGTQARTNRPSVSSLNVLQRMLRRVPREHDSQGLEARVARRVHRQISRRGGLDQISKRRAGELLDELGALLD
jgi:hypothetical protein